MKPILYSYFRSSCSWRVRIALALKQVDYDYHAVHLIKDGGEQNSEDYKKVNPVGQVPALKVGDKILTQSIPIIEYLDEVYPEPPLLPSDAYSRSVVRSIAEVISSSIQPLQNLSVLQHLQSNYNLDNDGKIAWGAYWIERGFLALEKLLEENAGTYSVGNQITLADLLLVPQVYNANRFNVDLSPFPNISRINKALSELAPFKAADPKMQPDCPDDLK